MNILLLFPHFISPGGAATASIQFAKHLQLRGHEVVIVCAKASKSIIPEHPTLEIIELNIPISSSILYWALFPFWQIKINKLISKYPGHILFPQVLPSNWWAWFFKKTNSKAKIVWYCHEPSAFIHSSKWINSLPGVTTLIAKAIRPFTRLIDLWLEKSNDLVLCNSEFTLKQYQKVYQRKAHAVAYPPIGKFTGISTDSDLGDYIFTISRLTKFKNIGTLISAFNKFSNSRPNYKLLIAGTGEFKKELEHMAVSLISNDRIEFLGNVSENLKESLYANARVTVITAEDEAFGIVPVESMRLGTPVIAHNSGGPRETVSPGKTGFLFDTESELVLYLNEIANLSPERIAKYSKFCKERAKLFSVSRSVDSLEKTMLSL